MMATRTIRITAAMALTALSGCAAYKTPGNAEDAAAGKAYQAQYRATGTDSNAREARNRRSVEMNAARCTAPAAPGGAPMPAALAGEALSRGDLLRIEVGEDDLFTGEFEVSRDGTLRAPYISPVRAQGESVETVEAELRRRLVAEGYYPAPGPRVSVRVAEFGSASVNVAGAVFEPGTFEIGRVGSNDRDAARQAAPGGSTEGRNLSNALRAAGGVRPDADLSRVRLTRNGVTHVLDLGGAEDGRAFPDVMLLSGDRLEIESRGCFQEALMAPSPITAPGVKVFMSNLTVPANANALSAIDKDTRELRYGTRFLQAVVGMNCVGGTKATNADRSAVLFSRNPITGASVVIERPIEDLLRSDRRDEFDPYILPGDAIACYDSRFIDVIDVARSVGAVAALAAIAGL